MNDSFNINSFAAIQYMGESGDLYSCFEALVRLIHFGGEIEDVKLLTVPSGEQAHHCFLLSVNGMHTAIKSGFTSGYHGSGPINLSAALQILKQYQIAVTEYLIAPDIIERVDRSCLLQEDLEMIGSQKAQPSYRLSRYMEYGDYSLGGGKLQEQFPIEIPIRIIDERILDLAIQFKQNRASTELRDHAILTGYRRLEDNIRKRTGLTHDNGEKLFSKAFMKEHSLLYWENLHPTEAKGRAQLFSATFMGYRNRRAHKENQDSRENDLREFLLLNELFCLEAEAVERQPNQE